MADPTPIRRLYRSANDRMIAGVCGGLAEYLKVDPTLVRIGMVVLFFATGGAVGIGYLIAIPIIPTDGAGDTAR